jgi:hypothetical protein
LLELFENIAEASTTTLSASSSKLFMKALEASKPLTERVLSPKRVLLLFIASHTSLVIDPALALITKSFISIVNSSKFLFRFWSFVHIRVVLFG